MSERESLQRFGLFPPPPVKQTGGFETSFLTPEAAAVKPKIRTLCFVGATLPLGQTNYNREAKGHSLTL